MEDEADDLIMQTVPQPKAKNLRRVVPLFIRLTKSEKLSVRQRSKAVGLNMKEYVRCKIFDIPFAHLSGRIQSEAKPVASHKAHRKPTKATV